MLLSPSNQAYCNQMATRADYLHPYYDSDQSKCWSCHPRPKTTEKLTSKFIHSLLRHPGDSYEWTRKQIKHLKSANLAKAVDPAKFLHLPPTMQRVTKNSVKTRSSADADNRLDAFSGQSRSTNMVPFHMLHIVYLCNSNFVFNTF